MNLAPWRYKNVWAQRGGPIRSLEYHKIQLPSGQSAFEALATLDPRIRPEELRNDQIYGRVDGTGTARSLSLASYKAISEAIERWAFHSIRSAIKSGERKDDYGFDVEPHSSGMSAYPGWHARSARLNSLYEAVERWSVQAFWEERLRANLLRSHGYRFEVYHLEPIQRDIETVILSDRSPCAASHCYAFASARSVRDAVGRAMIELERNQRALDSWFSTQDALSPKPPEKELNLSEQRLLFFSTDLGKSLFLKKISNSVRSSLQVPKLKVDTAIMGPWCRFAFVWRCLFQTEKKPEKEQAIDYFLF